MRCKRLAALLLATELLFLCAGCNEKKVPVYTDWTIYQKTYVPATSGTPSGWGYSFAGDGGLVYIPGKSGTPARYEFFLTREQDGEMLVQTVAIEQRDYAAYEVGDIYTVETWVWEEK